LLVGVGGRPGNDRPAADGPLVGQRHPGERAAAGHARVDAAELLARRVQLDDAGVGTPRRLHRGPEAERVDQALDQLVVGGVVAGDEVEDEITLGPAVQPALVGLDAH
jgi:hypothetical protein